MKKKIAVILAALAAIVLVPLLIFSVSAGFSERTDVILCEYSLSEDGTQLRFSVLIPTSMGYVRGFSDENNGGERRLTFYSTFGGLNSSCGARNEFLLELDEDDTAVCFCRPDGQYETVLKKDAESGEWIRQ